MGKQIFSFKGMQRDMDPSKMPNQFAYEIRNMRIVAQDDSTLLSMVTEKGNVEAVIKDFDDHDSAFTIKGTIIGYCVCGNEYITLFTTANTTTPDRIYRLSRFYNETQNGRVIRHEDEKILYCKQLYAGNLNFKEDCVMETMFVYENFEIKKVYWIDGINQLRFINVENNDISSYADTSFDFVLPIEGKETVAIEKLPMAGLFNAGTIQYALSYYNKNGASSKVVYISPIYYCSDYNNGNAPDKTVNCAFKITVNGLDSSFDYLRIYSIFRSSRNGTPVCKRVYDVPTKKMQDSETFEYVPGSQWTDTYSPLYPPQTSFNISDITVWDTTTIRSTLKDHIYLQESNKIIYKVPSFIKKDSTDNTQGLIFVNKLGSTTSVPLTLVRNVEDNDIIHLTTAPNDIKTRPVNISYTSVPDKSAVDTISFIDTNISGEAVDYNEILYLGGYNIVPQTMDQKNNTLFLGNYKMNSIQIDEGLENEIKNNSSVTFDYLDDYKVEKGESITSTVYNNEYQLNSNSELITTFKGGETYKIGLMFQDKWGDWSRVIPIDTVKNTKYPKDRIADFSPVKCKVVLDNTSAIITHLLEAGFIKVRTVVASLPEKEVLCQGVLCPTVFNPNKRKNNAPYAQASWYFRTPLGGGVDNWRQKRHGVPQNNHYYNINNFKEAHADFENCEIQGASELMHPIGSPYEGKNDADYYPDWNILTINSPDLDSEETTYIPKSAKMRIIGWLPIDKSWSSIFVQTSTIPRDADSGIIDPNYRISSGRFWPGNYLDMNSYIWKDAKIEDNGSWDSPYKYLYPIYPFHRSNSLMMAKPYDDNGEPIYDNLETKVRASLRESVQTLYKDYEDGLSYDISNVGIVYDDNVTRVLDNDENDLNWNSKRNYTGNIDYVVTPAPYKNTGFDCNDASYDGLNHMNWDLTKIHTRQYEDTTPISMKYKSTTHGVFSLKYRADHKQPILPCVQYDESDTLSPDPHFYGQNTTIYGEPSWDSNPTINPYNGDPECKVEIDYLEHENDIDFWFAFYNRSQSASNWKLCILLNKDLVREFQLRPGDSIVIKNCDKIFNYDGNTIRHGFDLNGATSICLSFVYPRTDTISNALGFLKGTIVSYTMPDNTVVYNLEDVPPSGNPSENFYTIWLVAQDFSNTDLELFYNSGKHYIQYTVDRNSQLYYPNTSVAGNPLNDVLGSITTETGRITKKVNILDQRIFNLSPILYKDRLYSPPSSPGSLVWHYPTYLPSDYNDVQFYDDSQHSYYYNYFTFYPGYKDGLFLAELYLPTTNNNIVNDEDVLWTIGSTAQLLPTPDLGPISSINIPALNADCYFQRYDCLKTFSYTLEDKNQIVEMFSFMCETRTNIEGRYDNNRGKTDNTDIYINNFNLINKGYTQENNFYTYNYLDYSYYDILEWTNGVLWTMNKMYGSDIDAWTNIIPSSVLHMDGAFGAISAIRLVNDQLLCFQDKGLSLINYNERAVIANQTGVPVEIANSGKVSGKTVLSSKVGCSNKESIIVTESGVYWVDSNSRKLYTYSKEGFGSLSDAQGFETYFRDNTLNINTIKSFNDIVGKDVYFETDHQGTKECLNYNEKLGTFTSFFDYDMKFLFNFKDDVIAIKDNKLYNQFKGEYLNFFEEQKDYSVEFISNDNPTLDKIFTGLEFRADVVKVDTVQGNPQPRMLPDSGILDSDNTRLESSINEMPFTKLRVWDEYQDTGNTSLTSMIRRGTNLSQKFRIWRAEIGRDTLLNPHKLDRIRNPWARVKLFNDNKKPLKVVTHDIIVNYV